MEIGSEGASSWSVYVVGFPRRSATPEDVQRIVKELLSSFEFVPPIQQVEVAVSDCFDVAAVMFRSEILAEIFLEVCTWNFCIKDVKVQLVRGYSSGRELGRSGDITEASLSPASVIYLGNVSVEWLNRDRLVEHFGDMIKDIPHESGIPSFVKSAYVFTNTSDVYLELSNRWSCDVALYRCGRSLELLGADAILCRGSASIPMFHDRCSAGQQFATRGDIVCLNYPTENPHPQASSSRAVVVKREVASEEPPPPRARNSKVLGRRQDSQAEVNIPASTPSRLIRTSSSRKRRFFEDEPADKRLAISRSESPVYTDYTEFSSSSGPSHYGTVDPQRALFVVGDRPVENLERQLFEVLGDLWEDCCAAIVDVREMHSKAAVVQFSSEPVADELMDAYLEHPEATQLDKVTFALYRHMGYRRRTTGFDDRRIESFGTDGYVEIRGVAPMRNYALKGVLTELFERRLPYPVKTQAAKRLFWIVEWTDATSILVRMTHPRDADLLLAGMGSVRLAGRKLSFHMSSGDS